MTEDQYASSPGNMVYSYAELAVSSLAPPAVAETIAPTHGVMARLSWPGWMVTYRSGMPDRDHPPIPVLTAGSASWPNFVDKPNAVNKLHSFIFGSKRGKLGPIRLKFRVNSDSERTC